MFEDIKDKITSAVEGIDVDQIKETAGAVVEKIVTEAKYLDVGGLVSKGKNFADNIDVDGIKNKIMEKRPIDNGKLDGVKSLLRSGEDFITNYPKYYIEGLIGTIQDKLGK